jgi:thiamine kinase-like enzyme
MDKEKNNLKKLIKEIEKEQKEIKKLIPKLENETNQFVEFIKNNKTNYFIKKEINDKKYLKDFEKIIEYRLDQLMFPGAKKFFDKILYYWEELNPESSKFYKNLYQEMWEK